MTGVDCVDIGNKRYQYSHEVDIRPRLTMGPNCDGTSSLGDSFTIIGNTFQIDPPRTISGAVLATGVIVFDNGHVYIPEGESATYAGNFSLGLQGARHCPQPSPPGTNEADQVSLADEITDPSGCEDVASKFGIEYDIDGVNSTFSKKNYSLRLETPLEHQFSILTENDL